MISTNDPLQKSRMLDLWRETIAQCRRTLDFLAETDFHVCVNQIDITDAERAHTEARIHHLEALIHAVESDDA